MADPKNTLMQEDGKNSSSGNPCDPNSVCFSYPPNHHTKFSSKYLSGQSPHDFASSKYTDSDLYKLIIEKIEKDRLTTAQKEFKNGLKSLKLFKNVKDFVEYLKESKRVFHSKKKVFKSQLLDLKRPSAEDRSRLGNLLSGVWRFIACNR
ncbi:hypothetical protein SADUNF_Sadunf06G0030300 [Salix dunnii]|uniref:Uncharacterized protein n=1 Tax=Salix dunnii TaxID=1413687 RepID=A0A835K2U1_9ROSI|nr:hypothetical protein SADUNF_Sadunf06G0030300 [Salix dunnii]